MKKLIVGNWKMYPTLSDSLVLAASVKQSLDELSGVDVVIAPPTPWLVPILEGWKHKVGHLHFAAQNIWPEDQGAFTGETSAYMLKNLVSYTIIGHSERRNYQGEENELLSAKVHAALKWGIKPILCVGEAKKMVDSQGKFDNYQWEQMSEQLIEGLSGVKADQLEKVVIAYEPVWAIGTHNPATAEYAVKVITKLKEKLTEKYGSNASLAKFIYGGSVSTTNAAEYLKFPEIQGLLIGGLSVKSADFIKVCHLASKLT